MKFLSMLRFTCSVMNHSCRRSGILQKKGSVGMDSNGLRWFFLLWEIRSQDEAGIKLWRGRKAYGYGRMDGRMDGLFRTFSVGFY
jgi:hypothetical protein